MTDKALERMCHAFLAETENTSGFRVEENTPDDIEVRTQGSRVSVQFKNKCLSCGYGSTELHQLDLLAFAFSKIQDSTKKEVIDLVKTSPKEQLLEVGSLDPVFEYAIEYSGQDMFVRLIGLPKVISISGTILEFKSGFMYEITDAYHPRTNRQGLRVSAISSQLSLRNSDKVKLAEAVSAICTAYSTWSREIKKDESELIRALRGANPELHRVYL